MAANQYDISLLFERAFSYRAIPYPVGDGAVGSSVVGLVKAVKGSLNRQSALGTPIFMPARIKGIDEAESEFFDLPNDVITINGTKHVVKTPLAGKGRRGTVKEIISLGDYQLRIQGIAVSTEFDEYPAEAVRRLREIFEINTALVIECELTDIFGIRQIVVEGARWPGIHGTQNAQAYEFICSSDEDVELELINEEN